MQSKSHSGGVYRPEKCFSKIGFVCGCLYGVLCFLLIGIKLLRIQVEVRARVAI